MKNQRSDTEGRQLRWHLTPEQYQQLYQASIDDPAAFWAEQAQQFVSWLRPWQQVMSYQPQQGQVAWFSGAQLNVCYNCIDRHLPQRAQQTAIIWEGDDPQDSQTISYQQLYQEVCRLANSLKKLGIKKGDRVCIYLPMIPQAAYAMLACARIGAVHSVVFAGFSAEALKERILDADCRLVITADEVIRGGRTLPLKTKVDHALQHCLQVNKVLVVRYSQRVVPWQPERDIDYQVATGNCSDQCDPQPMEAEDPLFILYTSGSTGKPKGVLHTSGGYLLQATMTHKYIFNYQEGDIYWCTADVGWITGHSYIVYGPLANGATTLMFAGVPGYPDSSRYWQLVDKHKVNIFYTAPTAIRSLMAQGDEPVKCTSRRSLKLLGTVGEPINPQAWQWYHQVVGDGRCPIMDTWWQTETGAIMISPIPGVTHLKPGSATLPFFGVKPGLVDEQGGLLTGAGRGHLVLSGSWPSQLRTLYGDHEHCVATYYKPYPGFYFTGDGAHRDEDGYFWITGRVDDTLIVSGHRLGTAEIESALVLHPLVAEAAVVDYPHPIKGEGIYAYVTLMVGSTPAKQLQQELLDLVVKEIGAIARPDIIHWAVGLPKTRSGKIMRRILRKIAAGDSEQLGDTSTLADPGVIAQLVASKPTEV
jgi:acetyl-CoA synthetase